MSNYKSKVSVIVLNYNGLSFLKKCLSSLRNQAYKNYEIIVVDNNSTDGSLEYLKKTSNIKLVQNKKNYGYAKANNIAARVAAGNFLFFLNNDTEVFKKSLENLVACYREKSIVCARQIPMWDKLQEGFAGGGR